jgi:hypothetical protein
MTRAGCQRAHFLTPGVGKIFSSKHFVMSLRIATPWRGCVLIVLSLALATASHAALGATIGLNFTGVEWSEGFSLNGGGYSPPDNAGSVGPANVVQLINGAFAVYDKTTGVQQQLISGRLFWTQAGFTPGGGPGTTNLGVFNERILYDPASGRWIAAGLTGETINNRVLVARSETSNPLGEWKSVNFLGNAGGDGKFVDYTGLGLDSDGVYISTINFTENTVNGGQDSVSIFSLPKADLLAPSPTAINLSRFDVLDPGEYGISIQPIVNFGVSSGTAPLLGTSVANTDTVLFRSNLTGTSAAGATLSPGTAITVAEYTNPPLAAQPDDSRVIQTIGDRISAHAHQVANVIYAVHDTKVGENSAISWLKIDEQTNEVIQEGILSDPNFDYFQPSIAANADGDIVISFNRSGFGAAGNLSIFAVVGETAAGVTTFGSPFLLKASTVNNYHYLNNRWGDWTTTAVDPSNPNVFWTFQEYAIGSNAWATQITQIIVPEPSGIVLAAALLGVLALAAWRRRVRAG